MRGLGSIAVLLLVGTVTTGCVPGIACPAVGWSNAVRVEVVGAGAVAEIVAEAPELAQLGWRPEATRDDDGTWLVGVDMTSPERLTLRALDADGTVLGESTATLEWERVGGSAQCGGPGEASAVLELG